MNIKTGYNFGDWVVIDKHRDSDIVGAVTGITVRAGSDSRQAAYVQFEVSWFANGDTKSAWFDEWRLTLQERRP